MKKSALQAVFDVEDAIIAAFRIISREIEIAESYGEPPKVTLADLTDLLYYFVGEAAVLAAHSHKWNEEGFCDICGTDGNA
jgi:hypothetical protein